MIPRPTNTGSCTACNGGKHRVEVEGRDPKYTIQTQSLAKAITVAAIEGGAHPKARIVIVCVNTYNRYTVQEAT